MGLYDCMYLVSKDQYQSMQSRAACVGNRIDGVGGDVKESQVNNIEVADGGTVLIHDRGDRVGNGGDVVNDRHEDDDEEGSRGREQQHQQQQHQRMGRRATNATRAGVDRSPTPDPRRKPNRFAAPSRKLSNARHDPNAIRPKSFFENYADDDDEKGWEDYDVDGGGDAVEPMDVDPLPPSARTMKRKGDPLPQERDLRRRALANDREKNMSRVKAGVDMTESKKTKGESRKRVMSESMEVDRLVKARLNELQGGRKTSPALGRRPKLTDSQKGIKMIHEMRDVFKSEMRDRASKDGLRIIPPPKSKNVRGKKRVSTLKETKLDDNSRAKTFHHFPLAGRKKKLVDDSVEGWKRVARSREGPDLATPIRGKKRGRVDDDEGGEMPSKRLRTYRYAPLAGRKRRSTEDTVSWQGGKRRRRGPSPPPRSAAVKRRTADDGDGDDEGEERGGVKRGRRGPSPPPRSAAVKRRMADDYDDDDEGEERGGVRRGRRGPSPPSRSAAVKRKREDSDSEEYDGDPFGYRPSRKKRNSSEAAVRAVGRYGGVKRSHEHDWTHRSQEEEDTGIPFKSSLVNYGPSSSDDDEPMYKK